MAVAYRRCLSILNQSTDNTFVTYLTALISTLYRRLINRPWQSMDVIPSEVAVESWCRIMDLVSQLESDSLFFPVLDNEMQCCVFSQPDYFVSMHVS